jgi:hypothetical protein
MILNLVGTAALLADGVLAAVIENTLKAHPELVRILGVGLVEG